MHQIFTRDTTVFVSQAVECNGKVLGRLRVKTVSIGRVSYDSIGHVIDVSIGRVSYVSKRREVMSP